MILPFFMLLVEQTDKQIKPVSENKVGNYDKRADN